MMDWITALDDLHVHYDIPNPKTKRRMGDAPIKPDRSS